MDYKPSVVCWENIVYNWASEASSICYLSDAHNVIEAPKMPSYLSSEYFGQQIIFFKNKIDLITHVYLT